MSANNNNNNNNHTPTDGTKKKISIFSPTPNEDDEITKVEKVITDFVGVEEKAMKEKETALEKTLEPRKRYIESVKQYTTAFHEMKKQKGLDRELLDRYEASAKKSKVDLDDERNKLDATLHLLEIARQERDDARANARSLEAQLDDERAKVRSLEAQLKTKNDADIDVDTKSVEEKKEEA
jgi:chromosome segregation ATPase